MKKRTGEMKNRRSIGELQKSLTLTRRTLRAAQKRIDWMLEAILDDRGETLKRIRFLEQGEIVKQEAGKWFAVNCRDREYLKDDKDRANFDATMNYKFPDWIERDRKNGLYNLDTGHQAAA